MKNKKTQILAISYEKLYAELLLMRRSLSMSVFTTDANNKAVPR